VDLTSDPLHCGTCAQVCDPSAFCQASRCKTPSSCRDVQQRTPTAKSGPYTIVHDGTPLQVYCDMTSGDGGWTLVYRVSRNVAGDPYTLFTGEALNDEAASAEITPLGTTNHYVSRLIARWDKTFPVESVRAAIYDDQDSVVRSLSFSGRDSTSTDWFSAKRLIISSWNDAADAAMFTMEGTPDSSRRFLIHAAYAGCDVDSGWLVVHGTASAIPCAWETPADGVRIFYAPDLSQTNWNGDHGEGKSFAVFVR